MKIYCIALFVSVSMTTLSFADQPEGGLNYPNFGIVGIGVVSQVLDKDAGHMEAAGLGLHFSAFMVNDDKTVVDGTADLIYTPVDTSRIIDRKNDHRGRGLVEAVHMGMDYRWKKTGCSPVVGAQGRSRSNLDTTSDLESDLTVADVNAGLFCFKKGRAFLLTPFAGIGNVSSNSGDLSTVVKPAFGGRAKVMVDNRFYTMVELTRLGADDHLSTGEMTAGRSTTISMSSDVKLTDKWYFAIRSDISFQSLKGVQTGTRQKDEVISLFSSLGLTF